ncbi:MAG: glycosyltransferase family 2 protein [Verrucomicrobiota bacterium]
MARTYHLSSCLCFKDSASYLQEWLAYYTCLGVEHFYLYNNDSSDDFMPPLRPYLAAGRATLLNFPGRAQQQAMYEHCVATYGGTTRWLMFCDDDEFLMPTQDISLPAALEPYERFAGVAVCWMLYGSSGHLTRPPGLVVENYIRRFAVPDQHIKCVIDPSKILRPQLVGHQFECVAGQVVVTDEFEPVTGPFHHKPSASNLRINHYLTKSREEMVQRRSKRTVNTGEVSSLPIDEWLKLEAGWNHLEDRLGQRYTARVTAALL